MNNLFPISLLNNLAVENTHAKKPPLNHYPTCIMRMQRTTFENILVKREIALQIKTSHKIWKGIKKKSTIMYLSQKNNSFTITFEIIFFTIHCLDFPEFCLRCLQISCMRKRVIYISSFRIGGGKIDHILYEFKNMKILSTDVDGPGLNWRFPPWKESFCLTQQKL